jgi:HK97 gp10 family phage protein
MKVDISMKGYKKLAKKLERNAKKERIKCMKAASKKAMRPVHIETKSEVPKRTGVTRKTIKLRMLKRSRVQFGAKVASGRGFASILEFGTKERFRKNGGSTGMVVAQNNFKKSANKKRTQALQIFHKEMKSCILKAFK